MLSRDLALVRFLRSGSKPLDLGCASWRRRPGWVEIAVELCSKSAPIPFQTSKSRRISSFKKLRRVQIGSGYWVTVSNLLQESVSQMPPCKGNQRFIQVNRLG